MKPTDITVRILEDIRDAVQQTNSRLDQTNSKLDQTRSELRDGILATNARLDQTNSRLASLEDRVVESEIRLATAVTALAGDLGEVKTLLKERRELNTRVERCEQDIAELKQRVGSK